MFLQGLLVILASVTHCYCDDVTSEASQPVSDGEHGSKEVPLSDSPAATEEAGRLDTTTKWFVENLRDTIWMSRRRTPRKSRVYFNSFPYQDPFQKANSLYNARRRPRRYPVQTGYYVQRYPTAYDNQYYDPYNQPYYGYSPGHYGYPYPQPQPQLPPQPQPPPPPPPVQPPPPLPTEGFPDLCYIDNTADGPYEYKRVRVMESDGGRGRGATRMRGSGYNLPYDFYRRPPAQPVVYNYPQPPQQRSAYEQYTDYYGSPVGRGSFRVRRRNYRSSVGYMSNVLTPLPAHLTRSAQDLTTYYPRTMNKEETYYNNY